ncbi:MAG: glycolate oxidase subunit GlcE [Burkholderiaceae bacterium]|nr:glycolate oxidase subunit GlcE [Burkholderiaceae bacterium]
METIAEPGLAMLRERVVAANRERRPLRIVGGGTKAFYGRPVAGERDGIEPEALDCTAYRGIVDYEPTELVVTVRCGTPLVELESALAAERQFLPFEPPHFGDGATVGGAVATGLSGPRRMAAGALRDYVLGATLLTAGGEVLRFGGQVMKNVAGYDVSRLLAGSLGVLGVIAEVSLKVLPLPAAERTLRLELTEAQAIRRCNQWGGQPLPISATLWHDGRLWVRLSGASAAVTAATASLGGERLDEDDARALWQAVREHRHGFFEGAATLWRLSLPSATPPLELAGRQLVEWGGALRWHVPDHDHASSQSLRELVSRVGGSATLFRAGQRATVARLHPLEPSVRAVHLRLKQAFDPNRIMNPGRMYDWL